MNRIKGARLVLGAVLLAATLFALVTGPGLVSDQESTVPVHQEREVRR